MGREASAVARTRATGSAVVMMGREAAEWEAAETAAAARAAGMAAAGRESAETAGDGGCDV